tara:strand:+ start:1295 stop:2212 length:918 start_codon:yes stop_codon:yes gene_type:complete
MEFSNNKGLSNLISSTTETRLCTGFGFTEGPVWIPDDECLLFSDIPSNKIHRWRPNTNVAEIYRDPSRHSNGLTLNLNGEVVACEHSGRRVSFAKYNAPQKSIVEKYENLLFNSPNDVIIHSSGAVYFTDPTYGLRNPPAPGMARQGEAGAVKELSMQGVYVVYPGTNEAILLTDEFSEPNGLTFSPDESYLYIGDSQDSIIKRFVMKDDGTISDGEIFVDMRDDHRRGVPDGMKVDENGFLWTTGAGGVWVVEPNGEVLGQFELNEHAANITFGGSNFSTLFLTAQTSVYSVETNVRGIAPGSR